MAIPVAHAPIPAGAAASTTNANKFDPPEFLHNDYTARIDDSEVKVGKYYLLKPRYGGGSPFLGKVTKIEKSTPMGTTRPSYSITVKTEEGDTFGPRVTRIYEFYEFRYGVHEPLPNLDPSLSLENRIEMTSRKLSKQNFYTRRGSRRQRSRRRRSSRKSRR